LRKKKAEIIEAILKTQDNVFRNVVAKELSFHHDVIEPTKDERKPAYRVTEERSRVYKKYGTTEIDYTILSKLMEVENAIKALFAHVKKKVTTKKLRKYTLQ